VSAFPFEDVDVIDPETQEVIGTERVYSKVPIKPPILLLDVADIQTQYPDVYKLVGTTIYVEGATPEESYFKNALMA
jgi:hypothetical protein